MQITKRIAKAFCTTREAAGLLGISVRTAQLWCDSGLLDAWKTAGGHRRITRASIARLLRIVEAVVPERSTWQPPSARLFPTSDGNCWTREFGAQFRVLVVEDDESLRRLYSFRLNRWSTRPVVETVSTGYEALARLAKYIPDMLIVDLNVPGLNGLDLVRCLHEPANPTAIATVVVSGLSPGEIERQGGIPCGVPVFSKPVPFKELATIAEEIVASRNSLRGQECKAN